MGARLANFGSGGDGRMELIEPVQNLVPSVRSDTSFKRYEAFNFNFIKNEFVSSISCQLLTQ